MLIISVIITISVTVSRNSNENDTIKETKTKKTGKIGKKGMSLNFVCFLFFILQSILKTVNHLGKLLTIFLRLRSYSDMK